MAQRRYSYRIIIDDKPIGTLESDTKYELTQLARRFHDQFKESLTERSRILITIMDTARRHVNHASYGLAFSNNGTADKPYIVSRLIPGV